MKGIWLWYILVGDEKKELYNFNELKNGDLVRDNMGNIYLTIKWEWDETRYGLYCLDEKGQGVFSGVFCQFKNVSDLNFEKLPKEMQVTLNN